jgi:hypothetical protein
MHETSHVLVKATKKWIGEGNGVKQAYPKAVVVN